MSKEISKAFRKKVGEFLKKHSITKQRLSGECIHNGYSGLSMFMRPGSSISVDNEAIVRKSMATLRGQK